MKQPATGDRVRVIIGAISYSAEVIEAKRDGCSVVRFHRNGWEVMTFDKQGHGPHGARLKAAKRVRGVQVKGAIK